MTALGVESEDVCNVGDHGCLNFRNKRGIICISFGSCVNTKVARCCFVKKSLQKFGVAGMQSTVGLNGEGMEGGVFLFAERFSPTNDMPTRIADVFEASVVELVVFRFESRVEGFLGTSNTRSNS